ncbi:CD209 antigen-like protein C isoform X2 [Pyxicephalus adspersus]|uniref:CD209 antigen-like protein C isoform X2 n=1 Tax=Pyxicephalus adspersus TaxID=30357 RepID=UPI003B5CD932
MKRDEDFQTQSGNSSSEIQYANMKHLKAQKLENNPTAKAPDRFILFLVIFLIWMLIILVIFTSLAFVYYDKVNTEVSRLMKSDPEMLIKEMNDLKNEVRKLEQQANTTIPSCENGWLVYNDHCYFFSDFKLNWNKAEMMCLTRGSHLVIITSEEEQTFLNQHLKKHTGAPEKIYWIGMTDVEKENEYRWVDGTLLLPSSFKFWNRGEPNNFDGKEDCIFVSISDKWNDFKCEESQYAICEKRLM